MWSRLKTNPKLREWARAAGLARFLQKHAIKESAYEERFGRALLGAVRPGDTVWDVGANVGHYSERFAAAVGPTGQVVSFEPFADTFRVLEERIGRAGLKNVSLQPCALGSYETVMHVPSSQENDGVTNSLAARTAAKNTTLTRVEVKRGDLLVATGIPMPDIVKLDVEAFEEEALFGMRELLSSGRCRALFCEVHFGQLTRRGFRMAPRRIESLLVDCGYTVKWIDGSHLRATRQA